MFLKKFVPIGKFRNPFVHLDVSAMVYFLVIGKLLYGSPLAPESTELGWTEIIGAFFIFLAWSIATRSWGKIFLNQVFSLRSFDQIVIFSCGVAVVTIISSFSVYFGLVGAIHSIPLLIFFFGIPTIYSSLTEKIGDKSQWQKALSIFRSIIRSQNLKANAFTIIFPFAIFILAGAFFASHASSFVDSLWYNLAAPRIWYEQGAVTFSQTQFFQVGSWDYLNIWANHLLATPQGKGMVAVQLFGQWTQFFLGYLPSGAILYKLITSVLRFEESPSLKTKSLVGVFAGMASINLAFISIVTKSDWGIIFFASAAIYNALQMYIPLKVRGFLAGMFVGLAFSSKYIAAYSILPLFIFAVLWHWESKSFSKAIPFIVTFSVSFLLFGTSTLIRNFFVTGNPFFPAMTQFFKKQLSTSWIANLSQIEPGKSSLFDLNKFLSQLKFWYEYDNSIIYFPFLLLLGLFFHKKLKLSVQFRNLSISCLTTALIFLISSSSKTELRYLGATLIFTNTIAAYVWISIVNSIVRSHFLQRLSLFLTSCFILYQGRFAFLSVASELNSRPSEWVLQHVDGIPIIALRELTLPGESILLLNESRIYYLSDKGVLRAWDNFELEHELELANDFRDKISVIKHWGFDYVLLSMNISDRMTNDKVAADFWKEYLKKPPFIVYSDKESAIFKVKDIDP